MRTSELRKRRSSLTLAWDRHVGEASAPADGTSDDVRPEIASSWERSGSHISPQVTEAPLLNPADASTEWESSPLCVAVRTIEAELRAVAADGDLVVAVTDPDARILWTHGGSVMRRRAEKVNFVPGGRWDEQSVGTNALDLALRLDQAATVYSAEHFASCVHDWVCWAAPVHDPHTGRQLGVLDLSTTWDRAHPIGLATAGALARLVEREIQPATTATTASVPDDGARRIVLDLRLLGGASAQLNGRGQRLTRRQFEILALLALSADGLELGELHAQLYGDRPVRKTTLKAEMSVLRAALGRRLTSRPYRIDMPVRCDVSEVLDHLRRGDVPGAVERYRGELLGWSDSPAIAEYREFVAAAVRTAVLAHSPPPAVLRYTQRVPYDLEPLERYMQAGQP
jgi:transcriptional regulator of acetoin/glycerol metabolism